MRPRDAKTLKQICSLHTDNHSTKTAWILIDTGVVRLSRQCVGEAPTASITLSIRDFNTLINWYNKDQKIRTV